MRKGEREEKEKRGGNTLRGGVGSQDRFGAKGGGVRGRTRNETVYTAHSYTHTLTHTYIHTHLHTHKTH